MKTTFKYVLDRLFIFTLIISILFFAIGFVLEIDNSVLHAFEGIELVILSGYYGFFIHSVSTARNKISYCRKHWLFIILLLIPFIPIARMVRISALEKVLAIGTDTLWHFLDELEML